MEIVIKGLSHVYMADTPFERRALTDVSLRVESGSIVGLIGPTGSGKSTLMQHIAGLLRPTRGTVRVGEAVVGSESGNLKEIRQQVGMVFQYPEHQLFEETVYKDIAFGPRNQGLPDEEVNRRVRQALEWVDLSEDLLERSPFQLSGGQMRRVAVAGVLAMHPKVLILDEPGAGLDPKGRRELLATVRRLHRERNMTVILVSHSMDEVARFADRLFVLHQGRIVLRGTPAQVFAQGEQLVRWGLDIPEISMLIHQLNRRLTPPVPRDLFTLDALVEHLWARWKGGGTT